MQDVLVIVDDQAIAADLAFPVGSTIVFAIGASVTTVPATVVRVATFVEVNVLRKSPGTPLLSFLPRVIWVARMIATMDHVLQNQFA